jgi:hypothetical protein
MFLVSLDPAAFDADYLDVVESHLDRLRVRYGIDFGRYYSSVRRMVLPDHLYARPDSASQRSPAP